jgi:glycosyltransferase involved in cell wall biosynthesis
MTDWVEMTGRLERHEISQRLAGADVYVAPAVLESFGIAALEARCAGVPVVASSRSGVGEFLRHGVEGLLARDDCAMAEALVSLLTDSSLRTSIAAHNQTVRTGYDWQAACDNAERKYRQAIAHPALGTGQAQVVVGGGAL